MFSDFSQPATLVPQPILSADATSAAAQRFRVLCGVVSLLAFTLVAVRVPGAMPQVLDVMSGYAAFIVTILTVSFALHLVITLIGQMKATGSTNLASYLRGFPLGDVAAGLTSLLIVISSFTVYKGIVVGSEGYSFDQTFIAWDRALFGTDPWQLTHAMLPSPAMTKFLDQMYHPAFLPMVLGYVACTVIRARPALRYTYMSAFLTSWLLIGMITAALLPSAGPIYDGKLFGDGTTFGPLITQLQIHTDQAGPFTFQVVQDYLFRAYESGHVALGTGISAMPSMHVVLAFLWVFAAWHMNRTLGIVMTIYGAMIWMTSVHLGWHYFTDGLVGVAMLAFIWLACGKLFGVWRKPETAQT